MESVMVSFNQFVGQQCLVVWDFYHRTFNCNSSSVLVTRGRHYLVTVDADEINLYKENHMVDPTLS